MDALVLAQYIGRNQSARDDESGTVLEKFGSSDMSWSELIASGISLLIALLASSLAFYLNWSCASATGRRVWYKILTSVGAFFFGVVYLFLYAIFSSSMCNDAIAAASSNGRRK